MRIEGLKRSLERIREKAMEGKITLTLENGEEVSLPEEELLSVLVEAITYRANKTLEEETPEISETAKLFKRAKVNRDSEEAKPIILIQNFLREE